MASTGQEKNCQPNVACRFHTIESLIRLRKRISPPVAQTLFKENACVNELPQMQILTKDKVNANF